MSELETESSVEAGPTFVLVHGAFQDASGWTQVKRALELKGATAGAIELAGRGNDKTPAGEITLSTYRDAVTEYINEQKRPVILVGHSFGGIVISSVAEAIPDRIRILVYLAAYLPRNQDSLASLSAKDRYSLLGQESNFIVNRDFTVASVAKTVFVTAFCPDCNEEQSRRVAASQLDEPLGPLNEKVILTDDRFGSVHKAYILTAQDVVVSPQLQALMIANTPVDQVYAVNAGHVANITAADVVASILLKIAS